MECEENTYESPNKLSNRKDSLTDDMDILKVGAMPATTIWDFAYRP